MKEKIQRGELKLLLMQIRKDEQVKAEELESFCRYAGLSLNQVDVLDVFKEPSFDFDRIHDYHALFVGGASEANVLEPEKYSFVKHSQDFLNYCLEINKPVFASCFGFQLAVLALGGEILHQEKGFEMGTVAIEIVNDKDPIYQGTPNFFHGVSVHQQKAIALPEGCELLAKTQECIHSFRVKNKPFWTFQFHPELSREKLAERLGVYQSKYTVDSSHFEQVIASLEDVTEANKLVAHFIDRVLLA